MAQPQGFCFRSICKWRAERCYLLRERRRCLNGQRTVRPGMIVVSAEPRQLLPGVVQRREPLHVQTLERPSASLSITKSILLPPSRVSRAAAFGSGECTIHKTSAKTRTRANLTPHVASAKCHRGKWSDSTSNSRTPHVTPTSGAPTGYRTAGWDLVRGCCAEFLEFDCVEGVRGEVHRAYFVAIICGVSELLAAGAYRSLRFIDQPSQGFAVGFVHRFDKCFLPKYRPKIAQGTPPAA